MPDLVFPVVCFHSYGDFLSTAGDWDCLTSSNQLAVKRRVFNDVLLVDSDARAFHVNGARKLHGIGRFGGWNIFLNQTIRVELSFDGHPRTIGLDEFKERVFHDFSQNDELWSSADNFYELRSGVEQASSVAQIIRLLYERDQRTF